MAREKEAGVLFEILQADSSLPLGMTIKSRLTKDFDGNES
jgi:hypothetical protein